MSKPPRYWKPLVKSTSGRWSEEAVRISMAQDGLTREEAVAKMEAYETTCEYWVNDLYQVQVRRLEGGIVHLNIRRRDGALGLRDWRHFQQIKNELVGPECEGIELYPAESRMVDTSNKFHIWCVADPAYRFPIGFEERDVQDHDPARKDPGVKQRSF